jgi:prevent-host-death family protein
MAKKISTAEFKSHLSDCLAQVAYGHEIILITRHGKPIAQLSPVKTEAEGIYHGAGLLEDNDSFFSIMNQIVADRQSHAPRALNDE